MMVPLSGGDANGAVLNTYTVDVKSGDCLMLSDHWDKAIPDQCYMVFANRVARREHPDCSRQNHLYFPFSFVEDQ